MSKKASDFHSLVILSAIMTPLLGGAIIYYSLKKTHLNTAKLGNTMSFIGLAIWLALFYGVPSIANLLPGIVYQAVSIAGLILSIILVGKIKASEAV